MTRLFARCPQWFNLVVVAVLMLAATVLLGHLHPLAATAPLTAIIMIPWQPAMSKAQLDAAVTPVDPTQPEVVPWQLYDTQSITTAVTTPLTFFVNQQTDKTLCNMEGPGQLPDPQYFICYYVAADVLQLPVATALAGEPNAGIANVEQILKAARTTFTLNLANKRYGPFRLSMCHPTGGTTGFAYGYGTAANGTSAAVANSGIPGYGGFPFNGAVVIPPKTGFDVTVNFGVAPTLVGGPIPLTLSLVGSLYRRIQ